jgi:putative restriction endonuclease
MFDNEIRTSLFLWLKQRESQNGGIFSRNELANDFTFNHKRITLIGPTGIWTPKGFETPISITTTSNGPYDDGISPDGILIYKYRGNNPNHRDNIGLNTAFLNRTPLVYFNAISPGKYQAVWPLFIMRNDPINLQIEAAIDPAYSQQQYLPAIPETTAYSNESVLSIRKYITSVTRQRLHQSAFREQVLEAYSRSCTICRLQHPELLDAAHIIADSQEDGLPVVTNGLALCKIHHSAYDQNIIGISPDYKLSVREDILQEVDGPMLEVGLKSIEGQLINLPRKLENRPDRDRLAKRFDEFRTAM